MYNSFQMQKKDEKIEKLEETIQNLQRENEDLLAATFKISDFDDENERIYQSIKSPPITDQSFPSTEIEEAKIESKSDIQDANSEKVNLKAEEYENIGTETYDNDSDEKQPETGAIYKIAHIHSTEYMKKLNYIRETAKLCIANYKVNYFFDTFEI